MFGAFNIFLTADWIDPHAAAYLALVEGSGVTPSGDQIGAVNDWFVAEKAASRFSKIKYMVFPIWSNVAANAIDLISGGSGSFVNTVTHANGHFQANGTNSFFDTLTPASSLGLTNNNYAIHKIAVSAGQVSEMDWGAIDADGRYIGQIVHSETQQRTIFLSESRIYNVDRADQIGIISVFRYDGKDNATRLKGGTYSELVSATVAPISDLPTGNMAVSALRQAAIISNYSSSQVGGFIMAETMGADNEAFVRNLKTLWETATGLTLP